MTLLLGVSDPSRLRISYSEAGADWKLASGAGISEEVQENCEYRTTELFIPEFNFRDALQTFAVGLKIS